MELEFDKEIDVLLRKARDDRGVLVGDDPPEPKKHLDADVIAAFAENAIPESSKRLYVEHFADCDSCRRMLSQTILMNAEADQAAASAVSPAPIAAAAPPWYERIFRGPNLALAMGALVLAFSGILGFLLFERSGKSLDVAKVTDQEQRPAGGSNIASEPFASERQDTGMANASAPAANTTANATPQLPGTSSSSNATNTASNTAVSTTSRSVSDLPLNGRNVKDLKPDGVDSSGAGRPAAAAPPAPVVSGETLAARDDKANEYKLKDVDDGLAKTEEKKAERDEAPKVAAKRAAGPMNTQVQQQSNVAAMGTFENTARKQAGGRSFTQRNGVWYDDAYHGQPTRNYKRGTDDYKNLDSGLRSIADTIGGTVVVVWKEKAYRIQ